MLHCSYKRTHKMVEEPQSPTVVLTISLQFYSQQICEFLVLLNFLLSSSLLASSPVSKACVRPTSYLFSDLYAVDIRWFLFHIAGAELEALGQPPCDRSYTVKAGDTCNHIAAHFNAPTLVSLYKVTFAHFTHPLKYRYQIICENDEINSKCTNLKPGQVKFILKHQLRIF